MPQVFEQSVFLSPPPIRTRHAAVQGARAPAGRPGGHPELEPGARRPLRLVRDVPPRQHHERESQEGEVF